MPLRERTDLYIAKLRLGMCKGNRSVTFNSFAELGEYIDKNLYGAIEIKRIEIMQLNPPFEYKNQLKAGKDTISISTGPIEESNPKEAQHRSAAMGLAQRIAVAAGKVK